MDDYECRRWQHQAALDVCDDRVESDHGLGEYDKGDLIHIPLLSLSVTTSGDDEALDKAKLKLDIIVQYLQKYIPKTSVRTRRSNGSTDDSTFVGILKCFSNGNSTKSIIKKISTEVAQLLLAHAFQAYISLPPQCTTESKEDIADNSLPEICNNMISAFTCLKKTDEHTGILPLGKEALFTAVMLSSSS